MSGKLVWFAGGYNIYSHKFGMCIPTGSRHLNDLLPNKLRYGQTRLESLKIILIDEYSMLRKKKLIHTLESSKQMKFTNLIFGGVCIILVGNPAHLPSMQAFFCLFNIYQVWILMIETVGMYIISLITQLY